MFFWLRGLRVEKRGKSGGGGKRAKKTRQRRMRGDASLSLRSSPHLRERLTLRPSVSTEERRAHRVPLGPGGPGDEARERHRFLG